MAKITQAGNRALRQAVLSHEQSLKPFECGIHDLTYRATEAGCPVCWHERELRRLRDAVKEVSNKLDVLVDENQRLRGWQDIAMAIRDAIPLLDDDDLAFLKITLYQWRDEKSLTMKVTHGAKKRRQPAVPNGFIVMPRKGDPYGHLCTSVGGMAIADYYDEALNSFGVIKAMELLVRGLAQHLPGGQT